MAKIDHRLALDIERLQKQLEPDPNDIAEQCLALVREWEQIKKELRED